MTNTENAADKVLQTAFARAVTVLVLLVAQNGWAQITILSENFEATFPGTWAVADSNPSGTAAYWNKVDLTSFGSPPIHGSGSWAGYCAGIGYSGTALQPTYRD